MLVEPERQREGIGRLIMERIGRYLDDAVPHGGSVGLMAAEGTEPFYRKLGYVPRAGGRPGMIRKRTDAE